MDCALFQAGSLSQTEIPRQHPEQKFLPDAFGEPHVTLETDERSCAKVYHVAGQVGISRFLSVRRDNAVVTSKIARWQSIYIYLKLLDERRPVSFRLAVEGSSMSRVTAEQLVCAQSRQQHASVRGVRDLCVAAIRIFDDASTSSGKPKRDRNALLARGC